MKKKLYSLMCIVGLIMAVMCTFSVCPQPVVAYAQEELQDVVVGEEPTDDPVVDPEPIPNTDAV